MNWRYTDRTLMYVETIHLFILLKIEKKGWIENICLALKEGKKLMQSYQKKNKYNPPKEQIWIKNRINMKDLFWEEGRTPFQSFYLALLQKTSRRGLSFLSD